MRIITKKSISDLLADAAGSPRKRMNLNLHPELTDPINRFVNAGLVGTYVRPHRHRTGRWELVSVLQGALDLLIFSSCGELKGRFPLSAQDASLAEIPGGDWHTFVFHAPAAVILEVKPGPYEPQLDKEFASWAPTEGDPTVARFVNWLEGAALGEMWVKSEHAGDSVKVGDGVRVRPGTSSRIA
jgi:cupin fold WbuC family metalloprotein